MDKVEETSRDTRAFKPSYTKRAKEILIIDSSSDVRRLYLNLLENRYNVVAVASLKEALRVSRYTHFSYIFLSSRVYIREGSETFNNLRNKSPNTKFILMTNWMDGIGPYFEDKDKFDYHFRQPFEAKEILSMVKKVVRK